MSTLYLGDCLNVLQDKIASRLRIEGEEKT
jgi:hypothetical protein